MTELKPCPFCGGEAGVEWKTTCCDDGCAETTFGAICIKCGVATGLVYTSRAAAIEVWNRRANDGEA